jgi:hypothetical protein
MEHIHQNSVVACYGWRKGSFWNTPGSCGLSILLMTDYVVATAAEGKEEGFVSKWVAVVLVRRNSKHNIPHDNCAAGDEQLVLS